MKGKVRRGQKEKRGVGGASRDHQHNKLYSGLPQPGPFFCSACLLVSSGETPNDGGQGMAVALMDLIDGVLLSVSQNLEAHFLLSPQEAGTGSTGQLGTGFPCSGAFDSRWCHQPPITGGSRLSIVQSRGSECLPKPV